MLETQQQTPTEIPTEPSPPEKSADQLALEAMDKGIEEASDPAVTVDPITEENTAEVKPDDVKPDDAKLDDAPVDVEAEMESLGIKNERSKARFRELTSKVETLSTALTAAGLKDAAELPELVQRAKYGEDLVGMVMDTGATAEHYGQALDFLKLDAAALKGDKAAAEQAFAILEQQMAGYARVLGREVPGIADPLADHEDLADEVESGDLTRKRALEIAATRNQAGLVQANASRAQEAEGVTRQQQEAMDVGRNDLADFDKQMLASDPTYASKREALSAKVAEIRATKPPQDWVRLTAIAYAGIPNPTPAAAPKPPPGPVRGNRGTQGMVPDLSKLSIEDAMEAGIQAASH